MLRASLQGLFAYRGRLVATLLAIALGVGFVTGTMLFVEAMRASFTDTLAKQETGVDLAVHSSQDIDDVTGAFGFYTGVPQDTAARVAQVPGVAVAEGRMNNSIRLLDAEGRQLGRAGGSVTATTVATTPELRWIEATEGAVPAASGEIAVDANTMETAELTVGQQLQAVAGETVKQVTLVGVVDPGVSLLSTGLGVVALPRTDLESLLTANGTDGFISYDRVDVVAEEGTDIEQLGAAITEALNAPQPLPTDPNIPQEALEAAQAAQEEDEFVISTGEELVRRAQENLAGDLTIFQIALNAFAGIALFVAAYVISNTFTILVTQRSRQLALMRCLGAKRGQVFRSTIAEALLLGVGGSALGIAVGVGLVYVLRALFAFAGLDIGEVSLALNPTIVLVAVGAGIVMTLIGSVVPAARATRVQPLAAMRTQALSATSRPKVLTTILGVLMLLGGVGGLYMGITTGEVMLSLIGAGLTFLGITSLSPFIVGPLARLMGLVSGASLAVPGKLATENSVRNPKRTAATTGALIIGVTLMTLFAVATESARVSALQQLEEEFPVDFVVTLDELGALPAEVTQGLSEAPEFDGWVEARRGLLDLNGSVQNVSGVDLEGLAGPIGDKIDLGIQAGTVEELAGFNIGLSTETAAELGVTHGQGLLVEALGRQYEVRVSLIYDNEVFGTSMMSHNTLHGISGGQTDAAAALVSVADGVSAADARAAIDTVVLPFPDTEVQDRAGFVEELTSQVNRLLGLVGGLLGLAVVIALLGIANTLGLSVIERVRESAVLRSLGLTRTQLRGMLAVEAIITALIGAVMGLGLGLMFAYAALTAVGDIITITIPWTQIGFGLAAAVAVGLLASVLPGRAAARTDIVRAMVTD